MCLSKHSPDAVVAHFVHCAHLFVFLRCSQFLRALVTCIDDPHRLTRAIKSPVRSQVISLSIHAVASLNKSLTFQCLRILECSSGNGRVLRTHPNVEPHTVRFVGDTDHRTKLEIGTASTEQKRVRSLETVGGGKRTEDSGSKIRNVASRVAAENGDNPAKIRGSVECVGTSGGRLPETDDVKAG